MPQGGNIVNTLNIVPERCPSRRSITKYCPGDIVQVCEPRGATNSHFWRGRVHIVCGYAFTESQNTGSYEVDTVISSHLVNTNSSHYLEALEWLLFLGANLLSVATKRQEEIFLTVFESADSAAQLQLVSKAIMVFKQAWVLHSCALRSHSLFLLLCHNPSRHHNN